MATLKNIIEYMAGTVDHWQPLGIVEVEKSEYKSHEYPNSEYFKIKGEKDSKNYKTQKCDLGGSELIWQSGGAYGCEDCYYGFMLIPYGKKGNYLKISYSC